MRTISPPLLQQMRKSETTEPWLFLYEITVNDDGDVFRFVNFAESVTWDGKTFAPFPVSHGEVRSDADGTLPALDVTVSNITQEVEQVMDENAGLTGRYVTIYLVHKDQLAEPEPATSLRLRVGSSTYDNRAATFKLVTPVLTNAAHPPARYMRTRCRWVYKSPECGYVGTLATCDKTLSGPTGCVFHGEDDATNGRTVLHPKRFGGQPGIARFT